MIDQAAAVSSEAGFQALETLLEQYRPALVAHLVYVKRIGRDQANDYVQGFIAGKILQGELIARAERSKGKFRTFLLTAFDRYILNEIEKEHARKRMPEGGFVALDEALDAPGTEQGGTSTFDIAWVQEIIRRTIEQIREECLSNGRESYWTVFEARILAPVLEGRKAPAYDELLRDTEFKSPMQASNALITMKRMFARRIRSVIGEYAADEDDIQQELEELRDILAGAM